MIIMQGKISDFLGKIPQETMYDYPNFNTRNDVFEFLYEVRDQFKYRVHTIDEEYKDFLWLTLNRIIPNCKYYDKDVLEMVEEVRDTIVKSHGKVKISSLVGDKYLVEH